MKEGEGMLEAVKVWVSNIIAIILFVSIVEIILPEGKMRKYVNLVAGVVVVLIIISPLVKAFNKNIEIDMPEMNIKEPISIQELKIQGQKIESMRSKQIICTYKEKMEKSIKEQVNEISGVDCQRVICKVKEDSRNENFGDIDEVTLYVSKKQDKFQNSKIEPVKIKLSEKVQSKVDNTEKISEEIKNQIIKKISNTFRISNEHIKIINSANR